MRRTSVRRLVTRLILSFLSLVPAHAQAQHGDLADKQARAQQAMQTERYDEAVALYADLVRALPDNPGLRMNLGLALHSAGRYERAAAEFERVVSHQPDMTPAWLMLAMARLKLGRPETAIDPLERVVAKEPRNTVARLELADANLSLGRFDKAARHFETLATLDPQAPKAWLGAGRSYAAVARRTFERLEETAIDSAYWAALIGRSRASQQQYRSAFALYRLALSRNPGLRGAHAALADIYRRTGHDEWADEEDRRERALPPPDCAAEPLACDFMKGRYRDLVARLAHVTTPEALYWRSLAASELALAAFAQLDALPPSPELHGARAEAYRLRGLHDLSIKEWQAALNLAPDDRRLKSELAQSYWLNQEYEIARPVLEQLLRDDPGSPMLNLALGDTLLQLQRPAEAIPPLEKAIARTPEPTGARSALARAYARDGQWDRAIPHLERARGSDDDGSVHVLLARAYTNVGRPADAERMLKRSQELAAAAAARHKRMTEEQQITAPDR